MWRADSSDGSYYSQHRLSLRCLQCAVYVRPFSLAEHDPQVIYEVWKVRQFHFDLLVLNSWQG